MFFKNATLLSFLFVALTITAQEKILYKQVDTTRLYLEVYEPSKQNLTGSNAAMLFFFGGGWNGGSTHQFKPHAEYFAKRGVVCFLVDYRVKSRNKTSPFESLKDAKSAMRFVRKNAKKFGIDPSKIIGSGGSAGGHLAAATALIDGYNENADDISISCKPNALVLYNPVVDNGPAGYGYERIGDAYKNFSPLHNIKKDAPPTIFFLGTKDKLIPVVTAQYYKAAMEKVGSRCDLILYEGEGHGFFNLSKLNNYQKTVLETDIFLQDLGYIKKDYILKESVPKPVKK